MKVDLSKNTGMLQLIASSWALGTEISVQQEALLSLKAESAARKKKVEMSPFSSQKNKMGENEPQIISIITHISAVVGMGWVKQQEKQASGEQVLKN